MPWYVYAAFVVLITALILFDLCVLHRKSHAISVKSALMWTGIWVTISLLFNIAIYFIYQNNLFQVPEGALKLSGMDAALQYLTAYLIEYSLSLDNIFVIALIISTFRVPAEHQHRLLFWGILGAAVLRGLMIMGGSAMMTYFDWTIYFFGGLLIVSAIKMLTSKEENFDPDNNFMIRIVRKWYPVTSEFHGSKFFIIRDGARVATPMFLALILIESSDVVFAVDSIPAVFGVTKDPFLVFTSNIFAILGLRSLYFALAGMMGKFRYLKLALIVLLFFVGGKMILSKALGGHLSNTVSLSIIVAILGVGVIASLLAPEEKHGKLESDGSDDHSA